MQVPLTQPTMVAEIVVALKWFGRGGVYLQANIEVFKPGGH